MNEAENVDLKSEFLIMVACVHTIGKLLQRNSDDIELKACSRCSSGRPSRCVYN